MRFMFTFLLILALGFGLRADDIRDLEKKVEGILKKDNVDQRAGVDDIFRLGDLYLEKGKEGKAAKYFEAGLRIDSFRQAYQLKLAEIYAGKKSKKKEAIAKAKGAYLYAEDPAVIAGAEALLTRLKAEFSKVTKVETKFDKTIVILKYEGANDHLVIETANRLQELLGINFKIVDCKLKLETPDRDMLNQFIVETMAGFRENLNERAMSELRILYDAEKKAPDHPKGDLGFIFWVHKKMGASEENMAQFRTMVAKLSARKQFDADKHLDVIRKAYPLKDPKVVGYLGFTGEDIYAKDYNFVFGWSGRGHALMSSWRFMSGNNDEKEKRPKAVNRSIKQGISSSLQILGIDRCTSAMCARAYPESVSEHDQKELKMCDWCKEKLSQVKAGGN